MSYASEVLADSPLAYWRLGDGAGTTAADSSGNSRTAAWNIAPTYVSGLLVGDANGAAKPNGHFASIADAAWMDVSALTVEAWVKFDSVVAGSGIVDRYEAGLTNNSAFLMYLPSGKLAFLVRDNVGDKLAMAAATPSTGVTYHVVGTCDGSNVKLYVNNSLVATTSCGPLAAGTAPILIGKTFFNSQFTDGTIDEVAVYGSALSPTRIAAHYTAGTSTPPETGTFAATLPVLTASFAGTYQAPPEGTFAPVLPVPTAAFTGMYSGPVLGSLAATLPVPEATFTGSYTPPDISGTFAATLPVPIISFTGTPPSESGSLAATLPVPVLAFAGSYGGPYPTDTSNSFDGLDLVCVGYVLPLDIETTPPSNVGVKVDKALPYPQPVMVDGRPT